MDFLSSKKDNYVRWLQSALGVLGLVGVLSF